MLIFFVRPPIYLRILFYLATNRELSGEINLEMYIIEKSKKIHSEKTLTCVSMEPYKKREKLLATKFNA